MTIERTLNKKVPGVVQASVNFAAERVLAEYIPSMTNMDEMIAAIEKAGYGAIRPDETLEGEDAELAARKAEIRNQTRKFLVGLLFTTPLFLLSMGRGRMRWRGPAGRRRARDSACWKPRFLFFFLVVLKLPCFHVV